MKGLILAGGHGTRLRPLTYSGNKHMLPIANKPILVYGLEAIRDAGVIDIGIILGPINEGVRELLNDGKEYGVKITYIDQPNPLGLAHAVKVAQPFLRNEPFIMYLGDNLLKMSLDPLVSTFMANPEKASILLCPVKNPQQYGVAVLDENKQIKKLIEKPKNPPSNLALVGVYFFKSEIHDVINSLKPSQRGELEITDAIQGLLDRNIKVTANIVSGWWKDTGRPEDLLEANRLVLSSISTNIEGTIDPSVSIEGEIIIGKGSVIDSNCRLRGPIIIGENCHITSDTYIGPCTSIGNEVKIRTGQIEYSILMDNVEINCACRIVDSIIGRNTQIFSSEGNRPKGHKLIIGDQSYITL